MCVLAASECLQLCMTLLLASLHWVQTEKLCLRAILSALSLSLSVALFLCHCCLFSWSLSPLSPSVTAVYWLTSLPPSHLVHFLSFFLSSPFILISFFPSSFFCCSVSLCHSYHHRLLGEMRLVWPLIGSQRACGSWLQKVCPYTYFDTVSLSLFPSFTHTHMHKHTRSFTACMVNHEACQMSSYKLLKGITRLQRQRGTASICQVKSFINLVTVLHE